MRVAVAVAGVALAGLGMAGCRSDSSLTNVRAVPLTAAEQGSDPRDLVASYLGGASGCGVLESARATESAAEVVVTVRVGDRSDTEGCDDVGVPGTATVRLRDPLGTRRVVDGSTGRAVAVTG